MDLGGSIDAPVRPEGDKGRGGSGRAPRDRIFKLIVAVGAACLIGFVIFVVVRGPAKPTSSSSTALASPSPSTLKAGTPAPPFSLPALDGGNPVSLTSFRGSPVILNFFASWCPDCRQELAAVSNVARADAGKVSVVGVDSNESSVATATRLLGEANAAYPVALDNNATVATAYLVQALPVTYFLDADGRVVGAALGPQTVTTLDHWVHRLERDEGTRR
ncbi:MAG TPA: TlpA disulfide reductase family protein [Acidimicrobiales bacterium]|nr:TlpA disulfide reductase family protein [Acidimicrobiales bacterium]HUE08954.1 TlpA disulfide reductase family protein [Acidimicrobiales bacterium]